MPGETTDEVSGQTPVDADVPVLWPDVEDAEYWVLEMQAKLHRWSSADRARRFDDLFGFVTHPAVLVCAWERVRTNAGARTAGIDKVTAGKVQAVGVHAVLDFLRKQLRSAQFRPVPVRRVEIPKANGKRRRLGIPTVRDRIVQAALKLVLEPIFEVGFQPCSYGFRPARRAQDAIAEIHHLASGSRQYHWIFEADIEACFDEISHPALMNRVRARIKDKRVLGLVKAFLKAGVMTQTGRREDTLTGTPQGGILSPLLANIALSVLDEHYVRQWRTEMGSNYLRFKRRRAGLGNWRLIRYADDFVVMVSGDRAHAEAQRAIVAEVLAPMGLRLSEAKTQVVHIDEGFNFLGFHIRRRRKRGAQEKYVYTVPSDKAQNAIRGKVRHKTSGSTQNMDLTELLQSLARTLLGWANYFRHGVSSRVFQKIDAFAWRRIERWIRRKHKGLNRTEIKKRFCDQGWRFAHNGVHFTGAASVKITRYTYRGANITTPWARRAAQLT
jgi:RNA-directed DNA polymerase